VRFLLYLPPTYNTVQDALPLLVYLHGSGLRGNDVRRVAIEGPPMQVVQGRELPFLLVSPLCPEGASFQSDTVHALIQHVATHYRVNREQIFLAGFSMGGYGTWATAMAHPETFAAIVPLCGGGDVDSAGNLARVAVWAFHGELDKVVRLAKSTEMVEAIRRAGGTPRLTVLPDVGHQICDIVFHYDELYQWLLEQHRSSDHDPHAVPANSGATPRSGAPQE
jgi:predicted peptidase